MACGAATSAPLFGRQQLTSARWWRWATSNSLQPSSADDLITAKPSHHTPLGPCRTRNSPSGPPRSTSQRQVNSTAVNLLTTRRLDSRHGTSGAGIAGRRQSPDACSSQRQVEAGVGFAEHTGHASGHGHEAGRPTPRGGGWQADGDRTARMLRGALLALWLFGWVLGRVLLRLRAERRLDAVTTDLFG